VAQVWRQSWGWKYPTDHLSCGALVAAHLVRPRMVHHCPNEVIMLGQSAAEFVSLEADPAANILNQTSPEGQAI